MLKIVKDELPKEYERAILMEYYDFFKNLYGSYKLLGIKRFTANKDKMLSSDLRDPAFIDALEAYRSIKDPNVEFLCYGPDDVMTALARLLIRPNDSIQIVDILYLDYPDLDEKRKIIETIILAMEVYASSLNCSKAYVEIPKNDFLQIILAKEKGYTLLKKDDNDEVRYPTNVYEKGLLVRKKDGQNLERKKD